MGNLMTPVSWILQTSSRLRSLCLLHQTPSKNRACNPKKRMEQILSSKTGHLFVFKGATGISMFVLCVRVCSFSFGGRVEVYMLRSCKKKQFSLFAAPHFFKATSRLPSHKNQNEKSSTSFVVKVCITCNLHVYIYMHVFNQTYIYIYIHILIFIYIYIQYTGFF